MRITQGMMVENQVAQLQRRLERFERSQSQLGTGKSLLKPSDDPAAANRGLVLRASLRAREQEARNGADALTWLNLADSKLQSAVDRLQRARELTVAGASSQNATAHAAMATEIDEIRAEITAIANTEHGGRSLFGGFASGTTVTGPPWTYGGSSDGISPDVVLRRVGEHDEVRVNVTAQEVFVYDPVGGGDLLTLLDDISAAMRAGDETAVGASLADLDRAMANIGDHQATIGAATNRIDAAMVRNQEDRLTLRSELSSNEDVDISEAVMELQTQEVSYQATLAALSRVLQPSLVDFLR